MLQQDLNINRKIYMRKRNKITNLRTCSTKIQNVLFRTIFQIVCVYYEAIRNTEAKHIINYTKQRNNKLQKNNKFNMTLATFTLYQINKVL